MIITDYQVQNVLRTYTQQLQRSRLAAPGSRETGAAEPATEKVSISGEGKRRLMMDRMTNQVLDKMCPKQDEDSAENTQPATTP
jgi:hypothetical protein